MDSLKEFSVIISAYTIERQHDIALCIDSLKKQTLLPKEIILVLDPNPDLIDFYKARMPPEIKIVVSNVKGLSNARNTGIKNSVGDFVAFIDDDAYASKDWLKQLSTNFDDPKIIGVGGLVKPIWLISRPNWLPGEIDWIVGCSHKMLPQNKQPVRNPIGCNMAFRRIIFEKVGYFDPTIGRVGSNTVAGEEAAFSFRALTKISNSIIMHDPSAVVFHKVSRIRTSIKYVLSRSYYEGYSKGVISIFEQENSQFLTTENNYLKAIISQSTPRKLKMFYRYPNLLQLFVLSISTVFVFFGYVVGRFSK